MSEVDPKAVARARVRPLPAVGYRNQAKGYDPRTGEGARRLGGRFNPPRSFPVLYLCTTRACVVAELTRQANRQGLEVGDLLPRELWRIEAALTNVLDLTDSAVHQVVGVAHEDQFQAIITPSATGIDKVLATFPENLAGAILHAEHAEDWSEAQDLSG